MARYNRLSELEKKITELKERYNLSKSYLYAMIELAKMAKEAEDKIEANIWYSHFLYKTTRYVVDKLNRDKQDIALEELVNELGYKGIKVWKDNFLIPLFNYLYSIRINKE